VAEQPQPCPELISVDGSRRRRPAYSDHVSKQEQDAADRLEPHAAAAVVDVFVYVVVLNLFVEYLPRVISETFTLSLLTAVLLKGVLEIVVVAKNRVKARFRQASTPIGKVVAAVLLWVVLFGSKFLVLEAVAFVSATASASAVSSRLRC